MFFFILLKNATLKILKLFWFLLAHFNIFLNNYLFFKFINKCQKEILRCAPPSLHVWFFIIYIIYVKKPLSVIIMQIRTFAYWPTQIFLIFRYNDAFVRVKPFSKTKFFLATSIRNMAAKNISEIWSHDNFLISGDNILWCLTDHMHLLWFLCSRYGSVMKKKEKILWFCWHY